jgi:hypothetical protein
LHPEYKPEWAVDMLETEISTVKTKLKAGLQAKKYQECDSLERQLEILQVKKCDALSGFKIKKKAHRKIKPQGGLSYSLAEVISLAFSPSPQAP